jgi:hypothetical protein
MNRTTLLSNGSKQNAPARGLNQKENVMKNSMKILTLIVVMLTGTAMAGGIYFDAADDAPALRVYNSGTEAVTIQIYAGDNATNSVTIGSTVNTLDFSGAGADTISEIAADIAACTNSAGETVLIVDADCSLATDSTDDELLDAQTISLGSKEWGEIVWDTSVAKFYSAYVPDDDVRGAIRSNVKIKQIYGNPLGTGDVTLSVYLDGTLSWQKLMPEVYAYSNNTASVSLPIVVDIPAQKKAIIIRATRATTATTGMIGVEVE